MSRRIDQLVNETMAQQHLAGISLAIARHGKIIYARGYGFRNIAKGLRATPQTIYNIGSITKQFTAASIMLLQQDGKLHIHDPLSRYLPSFPWARREQLLNLLDHTSGISDYLDIVNNNSLTMPKILTALERTHLKFPPGSKYEYSNSNYILLGVIVTKVSGIPYDDFLRKRIFQPLQLTSTSIGTTPLSMSQGATGYTVVKGKIKPVDPRADAVGILDYPDGGVNTNAIDLTRWDVALDAGRVVRPASLKLMFTPWAHLVDAPQGYGLGLRISRLNGHREVMHDGEWTGFGASNATFPDDGFTIVMLSNTDTFDEDALTNEIFKLFYAR